MPYRWSRRWRFAVPWGFGAALLLVIAVLAAVYRYTCDIWLFRSEGRS
jgi:hypothetical protein